MKIKPKSPVSRQIDENLKRIYEETLNEDLPDRFADLLKKLGDKSATGSAATGSEEDQK